MSRARLGFKEQPSTSAAARRHFAGRSASSAAASSPAAPSPSTRGFGSVRESIYITGGTVIVPGGEAGLTAENGKVTISGGTVREP